LTVRYNTAKQELENKQVAVKKTLSGLADLVTEQYDRSDQNTNMYKMRFDEIKFEAEHAAYVSKLVENINAALVACGKEHARNFQDQLDNVATAVTAKMDAQRSARELQLKLDELKADLATTEEAARNDGNTICDLREELQTVGKAREKEQKNTTAMEEAAIEARNKIDKLESALATKDEAVRKDGATIK
jgi:predicted Ser/Thr protein kinase